MRGFRALTILLFAGFFFTLNSAVAQETTGVILGTVKDPSGAVVPTARVVVTDTGTSATREGRTDSQGLFQVPLLPPGLYRVAVEQAGFQRAVRENVRVAVTERVVVDFVLQVGGVEEVVEVRELAPLVQVETATQGRVIAGEPIRSLPLATRNYTQLLGLTAGVVAPLPNADRPGLGNVNPNVNGMRAGSNNLLIDGLPAYNALNNSPTGIGAPALDFLQEFKVLTSMFSAEYGRNLGSVVNVVTVSGTNSFHGSAWEFLRNTELNARPFFGVSRGQNNQNQFGGSAGGPVRIPGLYNGRNRTFFFAGYEGTRQRNSNSSAARTSLTLPTPQMRAGTFTRLLRDPLLGLPCTAADTRGCFPNNTIPTARIHAVSKAVMERFIPLPNAVTATAINYLDARTIKGQNDQYIIRGDHAFSDRDRLSARWFYSKTPETSPFGSSSVPGLDSILTRTKYDGALSWTHVFSGTRINEFRFGWDRGLSISRSLDQTDPRSLGIPATNDLKGMPQFTISNYTTFGIPQAYRDNVHLFTFSDGFTWIRGKHALKFGGEIRRGRLQPQNDNTNRPRWQFNGQTTGDAFADFLLDLPSRGQYGLGPGILNLLETSYNAFVANDFKVTPHLTLNLGLRYEVNVPPHDSQIDLVSFWPDRYRGPGSAESAGIVVAGRSPGVPSSTVFTDKNNFAPRFGFAWSPGSGGRWAVRGGLGIYFDQRTAQVAQQFFQNPPVLVERVINFPVGGVPDGYVYRVEGVDPTVLPVPTTTSSFVIRAVEKDTKTDTAQQWNLDIQRQLPGNLVVEAAYVGTHGVHLFLQRNINYPRPDAAGVFVRPYVGFANIQYQNNNGNSIYHSGQFTVQKRFARGSQILAAYTISKTIDDAGSTERYYVSAVGNPDNLRENRGVSTFDRPQRLALSFNIELPEPFKDKAAGRWALGGWAVSGISILQSGTPLTVSNNQSGLAWDGQAGSPGTGGWADYVGGNPYTAGSTKQRLRAWFNRSAFAAAPRTRFGTLGRNRLRGPGQHNLDFALQKKFPFTEGAGLQFRAEFFNILNHANFSNPNTSLDSSSFGVISSTTANARIIQFGLKLTF